MWSDYWPGFVPPDPGESAAYKEQMADTSTAGTVCLLPSARANLLSPPQQLPERAWDGMSQPPDLRQALVETRRPAWRAGPVYAVSPWERGSLDGVVVSPGPQ